MTSLPLADHSSIRRKHLDIPYAGDSPAQKLDVYLPEGDDGPFPLIVFIHGGAFMECDKGDAQVQPYLAAVQRGYVVASLNYRLSGEAIFPAGIHDIKTAVRFLKSHAADYQIHADRIAAAGGSAGGNYASLLCALSGRSGLEELSMGWAEYNSDVQTGVVWYPPTDFLLMDSHLAESDLHPQDHNDADSPESRYMGGQITTLDPLWVQQANPMTYVHENMPPMLIQHGRLDHIVPWQQSAIFVEKIRSICDRDAVQYDVFETADHADPQFETAENMERVFAFLDSCLK